MKRRKNPAPVQNAPQESGAEAVTDFKSKQTDPQGSYTGRPLSVWDFPVQDADDL